MKDLEKRLAVPVSNRDHILGTDQARVTLVEYGDYECPASGAAYWILKKVQTELGEMMPLVFRNFPRNDLHAHAELAAEAAEAAGAQGRFWEMHDLLYENQNALADEDLAKYAEALALDVNRFMNELEAQTYAGRIREDLESGLRSGISSTPAFFIDGRKFGGPIDQKLLVMALLQPSAINVIA